MKKAIFQVDHLYFSYHDTLVLDDVNVLLYNNEIISFFGPNAGGKTTLLHLMMGFLTPSHGSLSLFGTAPLKSTHRIGFVQQNFAFDADFPITNLDVVLGGTLPNFWGRYSKKDKQRAHQLLIDMGLKPIIHRGFSQISGGQKQRVLLARALMSDPEILFLDEPTSNLDSEAKKNIYELLTTLKQTMTIVMVTHDIQGVLEISDRFFLVRQKVQELEKNQICSHVPLGLYHPRSSQ